MRSGAPLSAVGALFQTRDSANSDPICQFSPTRVVGQFELERECDFGDHEPFGLDFQSHLGAPGGNIEICHIERPRRVLRERGGAGRGCAYALWHEQKPPWVPAAL